MPMLILFQAQFLLFYHCLLSLCAITKRYDFGLGLESSSISCVDELSSPVRIGVSTFVSENVELLSDSCVTMVVMPDSVSLWSPFLIIVKFCTFPAFLFDAFFGRVSNPSSITLLPGTEPDVPLRSRVFAYYVLSKFASCLWIGVLNLA